MAKAVAEMVRQLRKLSGAHKPTNGLILGNGGVLTTESAITLSTHGRRGNYRYPTIDNYKLLPARQLPPSISLHGEGEATVEVCYHLPTDLKFC